MRDPFKHPRPLRLPSEFHIAIVGTGFAGIGAAIALKKAGFHNFTIFEKNSGIGGTWHDNTYPGAACDVKSHLYSFSFELNPNWSHLFARQAEILKYIEHCADKYELRGHIRLNTKIQDAHFDETQGRWTLTTAAGDTHHSNVVISACGGLSRPSYPTIEGLEDFEGERFHTASWNHDYDLRGKSVAVIGTGASAIQVVPAIASQVGELTLYQRTPPWVIARDDKTVSPRQQRLFARYPWAQKLLRSAIYWNLEARVIAMVKRPQLMQLYGSVVRNFIKESIPHDATLRAQVTPNYTLGCKRVLLSTDYYPALQRDNVSLNTEGISRIEQGGILSKTGVARKHDCIILATGFVVGDDVAPFPVFSRTGENLQDQWRPGAEAFKGTTISGYPNLFMLVGPNTGLGHSSMIFMIESQIRYTMAGLHLMADEQLRFMDVRKDAQDAYNKRLHRRLDGTVWATGCISWYRAENGKNTSLWPGFTFEYRRATSELVADNYELQRR